MWRRIACCFFAATAASSVPVRADVGNAIDAVLREPYLKNVRVGIKIVRLGPTAPATTVYEREATRPLTPASNLKLITTAAALDGLGADFVFRTELSKSGETLVFRGDGDPSLGDAEALEATGWRSTTLFDKWAEAITARGIKSADKLVFDDGVFDTQYVHPNWPADQIHKRYVAGVGGLNFNANCLDFYLKPKGAGKVVDYVVDPATTYAAIENNCVEGKKNAVWLSRMPDSNKIELRGQTDAANGKAISVTVADPSLFTATVLADELKKNGVTIAGSVERDTATATSRPDAQVLALYETPIAQILARANKDSMNVYAEALCKRLGARQLGRPGTWPNGTKAVGQFLLSLGVKESEFSLDDGSGLSKHNTISPNAIVDVLQHEFYAKHRDTYLTSLSVAGVDGTLKDRFARGPLRERVIGKSGFIAGVSALAGFVKAKDGSTYAFSILFNGIAEGTNNTAKALQERIVGAID